jgi:hypothetical protein
MKCAHLECIPDVSTKVQTPDQDIDRAAERKHTVMLFWALLVSGQITMRGSTADKTSPSHQTAL